MLSWSEQIRRGRLQNAVAKQIDVVNACAFGLTFTEKLGSLVRFFTGVVAKYALPGAGIGAAVGAGVGATVGTFAVPVPVLGTLTGASGGAALCAPCGFMVGLVVGVLVEFYRTTLGAHYRRERLDTGTAEQLAEQGLFKCNFTATGQVTATQQGSETEQKEEESSATKQTATNLQLGKNVFLLLKAVQSTVNNSRENNSWTTTLASAVLPRAGARK